MRGGRPCWVVALVRNGQPHAQHREAGEQQRGTTGDDRRDWVMLDDAGPATTEVVTVEVGVTAAVDAQPVDAATDDCQQCRHERDGRSDGDGDGQRARHCKALEEVHADQQ